MERDKIIKLANTKGLFFNNKALYKLLNYLRDTSPIKHFFEELSNRMKIKTFTKPVLKDLKEEGFIKEVELPKEVLKKVPQIKDNLTYTISKQGIEFINSIENRNLNLRINSLTKILVGFGIITIILIIVQLIFTILSYFRA